MRQFCINQTLSGTQNSSRACGKPVSHIADIESGMSEILKQGKKDIRWKVQDNVQKLFRDPVED